MRLQRAVGFGECSSGGTRPLSDVLCPLLGECSLWSGTAKWTGCDKSQPVRSRVTNSKQISQRKCTRTCSASRLLKMNIPLVWKATQQAALSVPQESCGICARITTGGRQQMRTWFVMLGLMIQVSPSFMYFTSGTSEIASCAKSNAGEALQESDWRTQRPANVRVPRQWFLQKTLRSFRLASKYSMSQNSKRNVSGTDLACERVCVREKAEVTWGARGRLSQPPHSASRQVQVTTARGAVS